MCRIMVIGNAGAGKSTLSRTLSQTYDIPYYAIDKIQWAPNWQPIPASHYNPKHDAILLEKSWILDGYGSMESILKRLDACDIVILLDYPVHIHFLWAIKRQIKSLFTSNQDAPEGCKIWTATWPLLKMIWSLHWTWRPKLLETIYARQEECKIFHVRHPTQLKRLDFDTILPNKINFSH